MTDENDQRKCDTVSYTLKDRTIQHVHADGTKGEITAETVWCYTHDRMISACAYQWQERALKAEAEVARIRMEVDW